jgi:hypothetical protein
MRSRLFSLALLVMLVPALAADEGMWLPNDAPRALLKKKYQFDATDAWLEHVRKASVRFNNGGSGGFVSSDGLVLTNHHIGADSLQKLSPKDRDYYRDGYYARSRAEELKCPDLELNVLQEIDDVTARVSAAVKPGMPSSAAAAARRAAFTELEKEALTRVKDPGAKKFRCDIVTLYQGGRYHRYLYKKYTDVRLVFAPEHAIAFFGGDTDNFEYPRFDLDVCFFRVYEDGQPLKPVHYFKWSETGPREGDLVFVSGHPGSTNRLDTLAALRFRRDRTLPYVLNRLRTLEAMLLQFSERGPAETKMARKDLHRAANARKALGGQYQGLLDPAVLERKKTMELALRDRIKADPEKEKRYGAAWPNIERCLERYTAFYREYHLLERGDALDCELFRIARHLVRMAEERSKPDSTRLREYRDSNRASLELRLFSPATVAPSLERVKLAGSLSFLAENLGGDHPHVRRILAGKSPAARAEELVGGTKLADPAERRRLAAGGADAIRTSPDPMIRLARLLDPTALALRHRHESEVDEVERQAYAQIARARFDLEGPTFAPDATFTLRLAFGVVKGYAVEGTELPCTTTFDGAFARSKTQGNRPPFALPARWRDGRSKIDLNTPFNFVATSDTIGGNSGSPVINRAGELVGVNFDRNRHGLVRNFVYTDVQARHVSVHSKGILEALRRLYDAGDLAKELTGK